MRLYGIWQDFPKNKPNDGDGYMCDLESVDKFMLIHKVR